MLRYFALLCHKVLKIPSLIRYTDYMNIVLEHMPINDNIYPCLIPNFDHTPRSGNKGSVLIGSTPENWGKLLEGVFSKIASKKSETNLVFIKSWNEWGEGNYLEPDLKYGHGYLEKLGEMIVKYSL